MQGGDTGALALAVLRVGVGGRQRHVCVIATEEEMGDMAERAIAATLAEGVAPLRGELNLPSDRRSSLAAAGWPT